MRLLLPVALLLMMVPRPAVSAETSETVPTLVTKSPFLPPGFQPPDAAGAAQAAAAQAAEYEFRGVYEIEGQFHYNIYNKRDQKGVWLRDGEKVDKFPAIVRYDRGEDTLVVDLDGKQESLKLIKTSDRQLPLPVVQPPAPPKPAVLPAQQPGAAPQGPRPTPPGRRRIIRPTAPPALAPGAAAPSSPLPLPQLPTPPPQ